MQIALMLIGGAVVAFLLARGIRAVLMDRKSQNEPVARQDDTPRRNVNGSARGSSHDGSGGGRT